MKTIWAALAGLAIFEVIRYWLQRRESRQRETRALDQARQSAHDARRAEARAEAAGVEADRVAREGRTMEQRGRDLLGLARDLLKRDRGGSNQ